MKKISYELGPLTAGQPWPCDEFDDNHGVDDNDNITVCLGSPGALLDGKGPPKGRLIPMPCRVLYKTVLGIFYLEYDLSFDEYCNNLNSEKHFFSSSGHG